MKRWSGALVAIVLTLLFLGPPADARPDQQRLGYGSRVAVLDQDVIHTLRIRISRRGVVRVREVFRLRGLRHAGLGRRPTILLRSNGVTRSHVLRGPVWLPRRPRPVVTIQYGGYGPAGGGRGPGMQPPDVMRELGRQGYRDIGGLTRRGGNYVGEATGPRGERQRVIIDAESGRVRGSSPSGGGAPGRSPGGGFYGGY